MALQLTTHVMEAHGGEELAATLQLESSEEDSPFCTASEAIENHNTRVLASPTLEARHCSSSSSSSFSSQFLSAHSVSTLQSSGSSHPDNNLELEIHASEVHWSKLHLKPCSSDKIKPRSSELEQEIEASKVHWSELSSSQSWSSESSAGETNQTIFQKMRQNPLYQDLFKIDFVDVLVGEKIAEGGQAEIFELDYCRTSYENTISGKLEWFDLELPCVLKVFKAGYSLNDLQSQWPQGMLKRKYNNYAILKTEMEDIQTSDLKRLIAVSSASVKRLKSVGPISTSDSRFSCKYDYHKNRRSRRLMKPDYDNWAGETDTWGQLGKKPNSEFRSSRVVGGVVLEDDRFAFVLQREGVDLRKLIDVFQDEKSMEWEPEKRIFGEYLTFHPQRSNRRGTGPVFKRRLADGIIYQIALGMRELHEFDILHRDLKASNVLINDVQDCPKFPLQDQRNASFLGLEDLNKDFYPGFVDLDKDFYEDLGRGRLIRLKVADYECSVGVVGTGFWRAPEILQQLKDPLKRKHPIHFTREADVYSFAMTCYEVLTGSLPLEKYATHDFDVVLGGMRPSLPKYVPDWLRNLIISCWQHKPTERPTFEKIVKVIEHELIGHESDDESDDESEDELQALYLHAKGIGRVSKSLVKVPRIRPKADLW